MGTNSRRRRGRVHQEQGHGVLAYIIVTGSFSILLLQPSLIVAAVDRLAVLINLFIGQLGFLGQIGHLF